MATNHTQTMAANLTISEVAKILTQNGVPMSAKRIYHYIQNGHIKAIKDPLRPKLWVISQEEMGRLFSLLSKDSVAKEGEPIYVTLFLSQEQ